MNNLDKYPKAKKFLIETGTTLDQALLWTEKKLKEQEKNNKGDA